MGRRTVATRSLLAGAAAVAIAMISSRADAHAIGLSNGEYVAHGSSLDAKLVFARGEVAQLVPEIDANHDGHVTALEVQDAKPLLAKNILGGVAVTSGGQPCTPALTDAVLTEQDGLAVSGHYDCKARGAFAVDVALMKDLARGHRHVARVTSGGAIHEEILFGGETSFTVDADPAAGDAPAAAPATATARAKISGFFAFFRMGVEHILTGYDHLVFLFGLVLLRARVKQLLAVVTAFTAAHSITLALATLGILAPSPRIVEPAIALSIAYVGIENFFVKDGSKRWRITFPFGLIHGFGFAGALREIDLPHSEIPTALVSFNLGVEAGQLAVMAVVLPLVFLLRERQRWFEPQGVRVLSGAVALAGGIWFVSRVVG